MNLTLTERFLQLFTEVKPGEGTTAILMFANVFLILCAYYFVKPIREGWISVSDIEGLSKMEVKAYSSFLQAVFLLFVVAWYARLSEKWSRSKLVTRSTLFCISNMVIFWSLQPNLFFDTPSYTGIIFYLWVGMFGVFVVAQFWTFCADIYNDEVGKRLIPVVAIGGTLGAAFGSKIIDMFVSYDILQTESFLLAGTLPLFASIFLTRMVDKRQTKNIIKDTIPTFNVKKIQDKKNNKQGFEIIFSGFKLLFTMRVLLAIAMLTMLNNWVNSNGENILFQVVQEDLSLMASHQGLSNEEEIQKITLDGTTAFYGNFYFWINIIALILQAVVASRLLKYGGFSTIILFLPIIALISYTIMALIPLLFVVKMMKISENSVDYSVNNMARQIIWLPIDSATKYHAKPAIDTLYVRLGDGLAALTVLIGVQFFAISTVEFILLNIALIFIWIYFAIVLIKERKKLLKLKKSV